MGLELQGNLGLGDHTLNEIHHVWDTIEAVRINMMKMGFMPAQRPIYGCPRIDPKMLASAPPEVYATTYAQNIHWLSYASDNLAVVEGTLLQCKNEMELIENQIYKTTCSLAAANQEKKPSDKAIERGVMVDPRWQELLHIQQEMRQSKHFLESAKETCERNLAVLSRFVEFRKMELDRINGRAGMGVNT